FFFQAEDGIRDRNVTGVQTCALPIFTRGTASALSTTSGVGISCQRIFRLKLRRRHCPSRRFSSEPSRCMVTKRFSETARRTGVRSEERRVGKECRSGWEPHRYKNRNE